MSSDSITFRNIPETYSKDETAAVSCCFDVRDGYKLHLGDFIGLYKVPFKTVNSYFSRQMFSSTAVMNSCGYQVTFAATDLPDNNDFYQFCYISHDGKIQGHSSLFIFETSDDYVEEEDGELLIVQPKKNYYQQQLMSSYTEQLQMKRKIDRLKEKERHLVEKLKLSEDKAREQQKRIANDAVEWQALLDSRQQEAVQLQQTIVELEEQLKNTVIQLSQKRLDETTLTSQQDMLTDLKQQLTEVNLSNEELTERLCATEEENLQLQQYVASLDQGLQNCMEEVENYKALLAKSPTETMKREIDELSVKLTTEQNKNKRLVAALSTNENSLQELKEFLSNTENRLSASELCKKMFNTEISSLKMAYEKMSSEFEMCKAENYNLKLQLKKQNRTVLEESTSTDDAFCSMNTDSDQSVKETQNVIEMAIPITKAERREMLREINDRHSVKKSPDKRQLLAEQKVLKDRLLAGREAYKELYVQREKLQRKLIRLKNKLKNKDSDINSLTAVLHSRYIQTDNMPMRDSTTGGESCVELRSQTTSTEDIPERSLCSQSCSTDDLPTAAGFQSHCSSKYETQVDNLIRERRETQRTYNKADSTAIWVQNTVDHGSSDCSSNPVQLDDASTLTQPLPAPIQPVQLLSAKMASVRSAMNRFPVGGLNDISELTRSTDNLEQSLDAVTEQSCVDVKEIEASSESNITPSAEQVCPICSLIFPKHTPESVICDHIDVHYGPSCPICGHEFSSNYPLQGVEDHVQQHFKE